jgi:hypothetical protein
MATVCTYLFFEKTNFDQLQIGLKRSAMGTSFDHFLQSSSFWHFFAQFMAARQNICPAKAPT